MNLTITFIDQFENGEPHSIENDGILAHLIVQTMTYDQIRTL
jgi:hypothetical protein